MAATDSQSRRGEASDSLELKTKLFQKLGDKYCAKQSNSTDNGDETRADGSSKNGLDIGGNVGSKAARQEDIEKGSPPDDSVAMRKKGNLDIWTLLLE